MVTLAFCRAPPGSRTQNLRIKSPETAQFARNGDRAAHPGTGEVVRFRHLGSPLVSPLPAVVAHASPRAEAERTCHRGAIEERWNSEDRSRQGRSMVSMATETVFGALCSSCGRELDKAQRRRGNPSYRPPCVSCSGTGVMFTVEFVAEMQPRSLIGLKGRRPGIKRPLVEHKQGSDWFRSGHRWHGLVRRIDRSAHPATYDEIIIDETTETVVREIHELLAEHQGRGSARARSAT